jgi:predicted ester cyclase
MVDGKALVRDYLREVFSEGRLDRMPVYLSGEGFMTGVLDLVTRWRTAFSDFHEEVEDVYVDGDHVITSSVLTGTHDGVLSSRLGPIEPTGRSARWSRIAVRRLDGDRFVDGYFEDDEIAMLEQLGALDLSSGPGRGRHSLLSKPPERVP